MDRPVVVLSADSRFKESLRAGKIVDVAKLVDNVEIKSNEDGTFDFTLSTSAPDRSNDTIDQNGWETGNYRKNPVVLWAHNYDQPPVARSPFVTVDGGKLKAKGVEFYKGTGDQFAQMVASMYRGGFLNAVSVGFRPLEWSWNEERGAFAIDFKRQELLEWSAVPVPANPEALIGAKAAGIDIAPLIGWAERVLDTRDPETASRLLVPREYVEKMYAIARQKTITVGEPQIDEEEAEVDPLDDSIEELIASNYVLADALDRHSALLEKQLERSEPAAESPAIDSSDKPTVKWPSNDEIAALVAAEVKRQVA